MSSVLSNPHLKDAMPSTTTTISRMINSIMPSSDPMVDLCASRCTLIRNTILCIVSRKRLRCYSQVHQKDIKLTLLQSLFLCQQTLFAFCTPVIATNIAIFAYDAMAGNDKGHWIASTGL